MAGTRTWQQSFGLVADGAFQRIAQRHHGHFVARIPGVLQALVVLDRVFGIDRQPHGVLTIAPRQANGKFHEFITARHGLDIACVLLRA